jgi:hypothetical protein
MHVYTSYPLGTTESYSRWHFYPAPYLIGSTWYYATPWLWIDGDKDGAYTYSQWPSKVATRMAQPAPVTITMWGDWSPASGTGTIYAQYRNDSTAALNGRVLFVITEDSCYYPAPNGDLWHNHVARDYIPHTLGTTVSVPAGDSITYSQPFTINPSWNRDRIKLVTFIQNVNMSPDSTIEIWQGGMVALSELGINEYGHSQVVTAGISAMPNPAVNNTRLSFTLPAGEDYQIAFYDISGRKVKTFTGVASGDEDNIEWNLNNEQGTRVSSGVYLYRFESTALNTTGKVVVK